MNLVQEILPRLEHLYVRCSGEFSLEEAQAKFLLIMDAMAEHGKGKVMIDVLELRGHPTTLERFRYAEFAANALIARATELCDDTRFAYVGEEPIIDPYRFGENVARNRGMDVKVFATKEISEAYAWLEIVPPPLSFDA